MDLAVRRSSAGPDTFQGFIVKPSDITEVGCTLDLALFPEAVNGYIIGGTPLGLVTGTNLYGPYGGGANRSDEVHTINVTGGPSSGTFVASPFGLGNTAAISVADTAAQLQAKVDAVPALVSKVKVGGTAGAWTFTAIGTAADTDLANTTFSSKSFTGGTSPDVTSTNTTTGGAETISDGRQVGKGLLFDTIPTRGKTTGAVGASRIVLGAIYEAKLPSPIDAGFKADVPSLVFV